jgi:hypothetical protein
MEKYEGEWENGMKQGRGKMTENGITVIGDWEEDEL